MTNATDLANEETTFDEFVKELRTTGRHNELREILLKELDLTPPLKSLTTIAESISQGFEAFNNGDRYDDPPSDCLCIEYWQKGWIIGAQTLQCSAIAAEFLQNQVA